MTDYADIGTFSDIKTIIAGNANITTAQITEYKGKLHVKDTQYYCIDMVGSPATPEGINNQTKQHDNVVMVYIKGTGATPEANFLQKVSWIAQTWDDTTVANKFFDYKGFERIGTRGKHYWGYVTLLETIYNVQQGYTT